jgi:hypothetical protein
MTNRAYAKSNGDGLLCSIEYSVVLLKIRCFKLFFISLVCILKVKIKANKNFAALLSYKVY